MRLVSFTLTGQQAGGYDAVAETALRALLGVSDVLISDPDDTCSVVYDERGVDSRRLAAALLDAGYPCTLALQAPPGSCCVSCG